MRGWIVIFQDRIKWREEKGKGRVSKVPNNQHLLSRSRSSIPDTKLLSGGRGRGGKHLLLLCGDIRIAVFSSFFLLALLGSTLEMTLRGALEKKGCRFERKCKACPGAISASEENLFAFQLFCHTLPSPSFIPIS